MYRSVAQFGAWALAHAQQRAVYIQDDDNVSLISSNDGDEPEYINKRNNIASSTLDFQAKAKEFNESEVGKAGDPLPPFKNHMIRQRVTRHGVIYPLPPTKEIACLWVDPDTIGNIKPGPVRKWLAAKALNDQRFGNDRKKIDKKRAKEAKGGYDVFSGETPPPTAIAGRLKKGIAIEEKKKGKSWGLAMWSGWGSSHDENTLQRVEKADKKADADAASSLRAASSVNLNGKVDENGHRLDRKQSNLAVPSRGKSTAARKKRRTSGASMLSAQLPWSKGAGDKQNSPYNRVNDLGQADGSRVTLNDSPSVATRSLHSRRASVADSTFTARPVSPGEAPIPVLSEQQSKARSRESQAPIPVPTTSEISPESEKVEGSENTFLSPTSSRPHNGQQAYPFRLHNLTSNPSMATLDSQRSDRPPLNTFHSELVGDSPAAFELPSGMDSVSVSSEEDITPNEGVIASAVAAASSAVVAATATASEVLAPSTSAAGPPSPIIERSPSPELPAEEEKIPTPRVPTPEVDEAPVSPVLSPMEEPKTELISPVATPQMDWEAQFPEVVPSEPEAPVVKGRTSTIFDHRTSTLGVLGADGMPNAHHEFPLRWKNDEPPSPVSSAGDLEVDVPPPELSPGLLSAKDGNSVSGHSPASSEDGRSTTTTAPFKLRNPVFDARASYTPTDGSITPQRYAEEAAMASSAAIAPLPSTTGKPVEPTKAAPFKLRHTLVDLTAKRQEPPAEELNAMPAPLQISRSKAPSPAPEKQTEEPPPSYDWNTPKTNIVMPETVNTARPTIRSSPFTNPKPELQSRPSHRRVDTDDDVPPPPPPKDEKPKLAWDKNKANGSSRAGPPRAPPPGKLSTRAPMIEELDFDKMPSSGSKNGKTRPKMETFVTAEEGKAVRKGPNMF